MCIEGMCLTSMCVYGVASLTLDYCQLSISKARFHGKFLPFPRNVIRMYSEIRLVVTRSLNWTKIVRP